VPVSPGVQLQLLLGAAVPLPASAPLARAVQRVEILETAGGSSAFQILLADRSAGSGAPGRSLLSDPALAPFSRVVVVLRQRLALDVLMDGVITHRQLLPSSGADEARLVVTGEDLTIHMDLEERVVPHPALSDPAIAALLIARYAQHGIVPRVVPPAVVDQPLPVERVAVQRGTDLAHLRRLAARAHHVFVLRPGPVPLTSVAYWGPSAGLAGAPLPALSVGTGGASDVLRVAFSNDALAPERVTGSSPDPRTGTVLPLLALPAPVSPLARTPALPRRTRLAGDSAGLPPSLAAARAQALAAASADDALVAEGELDVTRYGSLLRPHRLVGMRGAGADLDGMYRVLRVTHVIERGQYVQRFRLGRPGTGSTTPVVPTGGRAGV
jgi:hypothetical protein